MEGDIFCHYVIKRIIRQKMDPEDGSVYAYQGVLRNFYMLPNIELNISRYIAQKGPNV